MEVSTTSVIAYLGAFAGLVAGGVALYNARKAVQWKRAELANSYLKDFYGNEELVFAGRCLDWRHGKLIVPEKLRPFLPEEAHTIDHDRRIFAKALNPRLHLNEMNDEPRYQLYRTAVDSFLSWLGLVASALDRKLFSVADIEEVGYWVAKIQK